MWRGDQSPYHGSHYQLERPLNSPQALSAPHPPILIGGESPAALRRAARHDGWIGLDHGAESAAALVDALAALRAEAGRGSTAFTHTVGARIDSDADVDALSSAGVDRVIVSPWARTREVPTALEGFSRRFIG